ncbi:MAG TPA: helix-hairpin-helix domain-containing protein [Acidimicrobiales bacterium]|nr:helix-hairpin-helix domain-containing protein [Acidimicrobiales bacterium]
MTEPPAAPSPPPWTEHLARWRDALSGVRPGVVAVVGVAVVVVVVAGLLVFRRPSLPPPEVVLPRAGSPAGPTTVDTRQGDSHQGAETVTVHAAGALVRPGVYVLPTDARVADAVAAAGGPSPDADLDQLNLATRLGDGDRVYVPRKGEAAAGAPPGATPPGPGPGGAAATTRVQVVDLNTATADQLEGLPGVGPSLAAAIVEHRTRHGRFRTVDDLVDVPGIGPAKLAALRPLVRV